MSTSRQAADKQLFTITISLELVFSAEKDRAEEDLEGNSMEWGSIY